MWWQRSWENKERRKKDAQFFLTINSHLWFFSLKRTDHELNKDPNKRRKRIERMGSEGELGSWNFQSFFNNYNRFQMHSLIRWGRIIGNHSYKFDQERKRKEWNWKRFPFELPVINWRTLPKDRQFLEKKNTRE